MSGVREVIGKVNSNLKTKTRKGYLAIANSANQLRKKTRKLTERLSLLSTGKKNR